MSNSINFNAKLADIIGWDIGGAHLKAVRLNVNGKIQQVLQLPCQLWRGLDQLETAIRHVLDAFDVKKIAVQHVVTMTGELVDLFANRQQGVMQISQLSTKLLGADTLFYAADSGFVAFKDVSAHSPFIASTNWHASASMLAMYVKDALLIDIGSTTTDIIAIAGGRVAHAGLSDAARMQADSLIYTGVIRTPVMALAQKLLFEATETNVAAEYFATMADVYRLTGELLPEYDMADTADAKGKTALESARRLARMIGHDVENHPLAIWKNLADTCRTIQLNQIKMALLKQLRPQATIIGAGVGSFLAKRLAQDLQHDYQPISNLLAKHINTASQLDLEVCLPAYAVAKLFFENGLVLDSRLALNGGLHNA